MDQVAKGLHRRFTRRPGLLPHRSITWWTPICRCSIISTKPSTPWKTRRSKAPTPKTLSCIFETKRNLIVLRRVLVNTRDVANHLQRTESPFINRDMWPFLRDIYDHVARNLDTVEMLRDLLSGALDVYLSSVANRTNQVMKVLTVLGTVALPAVVVSSIYGMNVKGLPGAESPYALAIVLSLMAGSTVLLLWVLKRFHWL